MLWFQDRRPSIGRHGSSHGAGRPDERRRVPCLFSQVLVPELTPGDIVIMDMCGRPRLCKYNLLKSKERGRVLTCVSGLNVAAIRCRGPVWEFAERVEFNLARSWRVSMIWFSRSRLVDRCALLSF